MAARPELEVAATAAAAANAGAWAAQLPAVACTVQPGHDLEAQALAVAAAVVERAVVVGRLAGGMGGAVVVGDMAVH